MNIVTPYYIFDKEKFQNMIKSYQEIGSVYYPIKANDCDLVVNVAVEQGCCFEVDSIEHINNLITIKGISPDRILYSYPIREIKDIKQAAKLGVSKYVIDSIDEYNKVKENTLGAVYCVRLNVVDILNVIVEPEQNKWGLSINQSKDLIDTVRKNGDIVEGLSFYLFNEIEKKDSLIKLLKKIGEQFLDYDFQYLNIGGGLSIDDLNEVKENLMLLKKSKCIKKIIIEPGSPLLNPCIDMIVSVIAIKMVGQKRFVFINAGIYNGLIDVIIKKRRFDIVGCDKVNETEETLVCGLSSDVSDFLGSYHLQKHLRVGDQLIIKECGAYSTVMQTDFYKKSKIKMILKGEMI